MNKMKFISQCKAFTLVELLVVIAIIGVLIALLLPAVQAAREAARRMTCSNQFKNHALAMHNYHDICASLPYGGTFKDGVLYGAGQWASGLLFPSWYSRTLPFIEQQSLYDLIQPGDWSNSMGDTASGRSIMTTLIAIHHCPSDKVVMNQPANASWARYRTNYVVCFGATNYGRTAVDTTNDPSNTEIEPFIDKHAPFEPDECYGLENITDGTSNTIFMSEVVPSKSAANAGCYANVTLTASSGFTAYWLPNAAGPDRIQDCNNALWGKDVVKIGTCQVETTPPRYVHTARSWHSNGVQVALGDGSCRFISQTVSPLIWRGSCTANDGYGGNF